MTTLLRPADVGYRTLVVGDSRGSPRMRREVLRTVAQLGVGAIVSVGDFGIWPGSGGNSSSTRSARRWPPAAGSS